MIEPKEGAVGTLIYNQLVRRTGDNLDLDWSLKWGQGCGTEPLLVGLDANSRENMLALNRKVGHLAGVRGLETGEGNIHTFGEQKCQYFPAGSAVKKSACQCRRCGFNPWVGRIPWREKWPPIPVFLPGESHHRRACQAIVHGVTESWTRLSNWAQ